MKRTTIAIVLVATLLSLSATLMPIRAALACTRAVYLGPDDTIITVRSMDWLSDLGSNLWAFPRGMQRDGAAGPTSIRWTSKYGSVVATAFEAATADGMNEKGLVANLLYLAESEYAKPSAVTSGYLSPFRPGHSTCSTATPRSPRRWPICARNRSTWCRR